MGGLFSYESKPMQILMFVGDLIILNVIYLLCCIPIFTIGAAQAGMFTACKVLLDKEDDSSPYAAFFRGFTTGFGTVTLAWGLMTIVTLLVGWMTISAILLDSPIWIACIAVGLCALFQTLVPAFHSRFGCKWWQLIRNTWFLVFAHPLRSIATVAMIWVPIVVFLCCDVYTFMRLTPIWGTLYFGTVFCFGTALLKKPFKTLTDHFNETHGINPEGKQEEEPEEEYDELDGSDEPEELQEAQKKPVE